MENYVGFHCSMDEKRIKLNQNYEMIHLTKVNLISNDGYLQAETENEKNSVIVSLRCGDISF